MTCRLMSNGGHHYWRGGMDHEGYRDYNIGFLVGHATTDGPANIMQTPGLPLPGSVWLFDDDIDIWAWCTWERSVKEAPPQDEGEPWQYSIIDLKFTTRPPGLPGRGGNLNHGAPSDNKRSGCRDFRFEDPLTEPQKIGGAFVASQTEATKDRNGKSLLFPTFERMRGPEVEFDDSRYSVRIEQNVPILQLALVDSLRDHVNTYPIWGFDARCVKLKNFTWERKYYGSCYVYYTRTFDFEINTETWDRDVGNNTLKCLRGDFLPGSGSGCTIKVEAVGTVDGRTKSITDASVVSGGSNYPVNQYIPLALTNTLASLEEAAGRQAVVIGKSNSAGVITGLAPANPSGDQQKILYGGTDYSTTFDTEVRTAKDVNFCLRPLLKALGMLLLPSPKNPSHFEAYRDDSGQPAGCRVNKAGVPMMRDEPDENGTTHVEKYKEADLLVLGIPAILET